MNYYFNTQKRIGRLEYVGIHILIFIGLIITSLIISWLHRFTSVGIIYTTDNMNIHFMSFFEKYLSIIFTVPSLSLSSVTGIIALLVFTSACILYNHIMVKRLHDINLSGRWIIIYWFIYSIRIALQYAIFNSYKYPFINMHITAIMNKYILALQIIILIILGFLFLYPGRKNQY